jgi:hypothetical protein
MASMSVPDSSVTKTSTDQAPSPTGAYLPHREGCNGRISRDIDVGHWARKFAELSLGIGFHQF